MAQCMRRRHTYALDVCICPPVDGRPEHVSPEDVFPALHDEERMPELSILCIHALRALPPEPNREA